MLGIEMYGIDSHPSRRFLYVKNVRGSIDPLHLKKKSRTKIKITIFAYKR
jgi:hypothetical protein